MREEVNVSFDSNENEDTMRYIVQPTSIASTQITLATAHRSDQLIHRMIEAEIQRNFTIIIFGQMRKPANVYTKLKRKRHLFWFFLL